MTGVLVNFATVVVGGLIGSFIRKGVPDRLRAAITNGIALCVLVIGVSGAIETQNQLLMIICIVVGTLIGEALNIERGIEKLGGGVQRMFSGGSGFAEGFVSATLLFSVGSMAVVGSLDASFGNNATLLAKAALDGVSALMFASTYGWSVALAAVPLTLYQGLIALLAVWVKPYLGADVIVEMKAVGSVMIIALSVNMLGLLKEGKLRVANMLPSMFLPILALPLEAWIRGLF